nr:MAG TPA: hypothetical protein [Caudoviricetes sp.]
MDDYNHISIRCGNTLKMSDDHFLNVNISTSTTNNDVAIGLI